MNVMELNLIPLWELIIQKNLLTHINYVDDMSESNTRNYAFIKSVLQFVPTVSPYFFHSSTNNQGFPIESLNEALKHSMSSVAVDDPKLYLEWLTSKMEVEEQDDFINKVSTVVKITFVY